jgi:dTMP kinase
VDRLERERAEFFERIDNAYAQLCREDPARVRRIDAAQPPERVLADSLDALSDLL